MLEPFRGSFNASFNEAKYKGLLARLDLATRTQVQFRVAETPCFFSAALLEEMAATGIELTNQLMGSAEYMKLSAAAIPDKYRLGNENAIPNFMTVDFGLVRDAAGSLRPKLVEMQAFPSVFGYQDVLAEQYIKEYGLEGEGWRWHLGGHDSASYWELLRRVIVGDHHPENVVLLEVAPETQKTLPDFHVYEDRLGISIVDIATVRKVGRRLQYEKGGRWVEIERIFNRAIVDEMERKGTVLSFDYRDELDVEWAGHPNWYFRISKFSLPYLNHEAVPKAVFLDDWYAGKREGLPGDMAQILLKPLYSFAGNGIKFSPDAADLAAIPAADRHLWLLQERATFEPVITTPEGLTMAEVRIMYLWPDEGTMEPVTSLVRMGRGLMMGVDQNRNQEWVGGSAALFR